MTTLARALATGRSGVFRISAGEAGRLGAEAGRGAQALHRIDLSGAAGKDGLLGALARALRFPDWFGGNWDALQDALCDLSWLGEERPLVLLVEGADASRPAGGDLDTLLDVLRSAARYWEGEGRPFLVLFAGRGPAGVAALR